MMTFTESIKTCFKKYVVVRGRATRAEYWWFQLLLWGSAIFCAFIATVAESVLGKEGANIVLVIWLLFFLATLIPNFCVCIRRLHDTGWSGFTFLWCILGLWLGLLIINIRNIFPSDGDNEYGEGPLELKNTEDIQVEDTEVNQQESKGKAEKEGNERSRISQCMALDDECEFETKSAGNTFSSSSDDVLDTKSVSEKVISNDIAIDKNKTFQHINFCRHCGAAVDKEDALFCKKCGGKL